MFFDRCNYKNSCFSDLAYNSSVHVLIWWSAAEIQKRCSYLKNVALDFVLLVLKLYPIQVVISLPLWVKPTMSQLLLFFLYNFFSFFTNVGIVLVTNLLSLLLIDRYILAIHKIITHEVHLWYSFKPVAIFWTASEALALWS